jgi:signal transduction histidine kinase
MQILPPSLASRSPSSRAPGAARLSIDPEPAQLAGRLRDAEKRLAAQSAELALTRAILQRSRTAYRRLENASRAAVIDERHRIAREIHDTVAQALTAVIVQLRNAAAALAASSPHMAQNDVERAVELARVGLAETRRCVQTWRAPARDASDLPATIKALVTRGTYGTDLRAQVAIKGAPRKLAAAYAMNMLRIVQEGLTNALRHAGATHFGVTVDYEPRLLRLTLCDDGCGFEPTRTHEGFGLLGIKERVAAMRGQLTITSAVGRGTTTSVVLRYR